MPNKPPLAEQTAETLDEYITVLKAIESDLAGNQMAKYYADEETRKGYHLHMQAFEAGKKYRLRAVMGGNRVGKTSLSCYELACHVTGRYPEFWPGFKFKRPIRAWVASDTLNTLRDVIGAKLIGPPHAIGTGMLPKDSIDKIRKRQGVPDSIDSVTVKYQGGGHSTVSFLPYQGGRQIFQGQRVDLIVLDEEPPNWEIFEECLMRTASTSPHEEPGRILLAFTPLRGLSSVADFFLEDGQLAHVGDKFAMQIPWDQTPHLSESEREELLASIPRHQRAARSQGIPSLGVGQVFYYDEERLIIEPFTIPQFFPQFYGLDVGWAVTSAIFCARCPQTGTVFVIDEYVGKEATATTHSAAIRAKANTGNGDMSGAVDPSSAGRSQLDGKNLLSEYRKEGLKLTGADNAVDAGLHRLQQLIDTDRLKIYSRCTNLLNELRQYHRDEKGKIVKRNDHCIDALRYAVATEKVQLKPRPSGYRPRKAQRFAWTK